MILGQEAPLSASELDTLARTKETEPIRVYRKMISHMWWQEARKIMKATPEQLPVIQGVLQGIRMCFDRIENAQAILDEQQKVQP